MGAIYRTKAVLRQQNRTDEDLETAPPKMKNGGQAPVLDTSSPGEPDVTCAAAYFA